MARVINTGPGDTGAKVAGTAQKRQTRPTTTTQKTAQATTGPLTGTMPTAGKQAAQPTGSVAGPSTTKVPAAAKQATQPTGSVAGPSTGKVPAATKQAAQPTTSVVGPSTAKVAAKTAAKKKKKSTRGRPRKACSPCRRAKKKCIHMGEDENDEEEEEEEEEEENDDGQKKLSEKAKGKQKIKSADNDDGDGDDGDDDDDDDGDDDQKQLFEKAKGKQKRKRANDDDDDDAPGPKPAKTRGRPAKNQATVAGPSGSAPATPTNLSNPLTAAGHIVTHQYMSQQLGQRLDNAEKKWEDAMDAMMEAKEALDAWKDFYLKHKESPS